MDELPNRRKPSPIASTLMDSRAERTGDPLDHDPGGEHDLPGEPADDGVAEVAQDLLPDLLVDERSGVLVRDRSVPLADDPLLVPVMDGGSGRPQLAAAD